MPKNQSSPPVLYISTCKDFFSLWKSLISALLYRLLLLKKNKIILALQELIITLLMSLYQRHLQTENVWSASGKAKSRRIYLNLSLL